MSKQSFEYEVAISFLKQDEPFCREIADALALLLAFVYSKAHEKLAGRERVEAFRTETVPPCASLSRPQWGETPST